MDAIKSDEIKALIATLPPEQREVITDYFGRLASAADDIFTLVDVSRLALESMSVLGAESTEKALLTAVNDSVELQEHLAAMAAEGVSNE